MVDPALFFKYDRSTGMYCLVGVATDDFTFVADSTKTIEDVRASMAQHFELVHLGEVKWLLGVEIRRDRDSKTISLNQAA